MTNTDIHIEATTGVSHPLVRLVWHMDLDMSHVLFEETTRRTRSLKTPFDPIYTVAPTLVTTIIEKRNARHGEEKMDGKQRLKQKV